MLDTALANHPRVPLGHWPTPLTPLRRLHEREGGPLIWLKRDDCTGLATGGNKTRKLEFLLGQAIAQRAAAVVTFGAIQSNHCRQTAAACAAIGLPCHLLLSDLVDRDDAAYRRSGNVALNHLFGATVHHSDDGLATLAEIDAATDGELYVIPPGGSNAVGALGYVAAASELRQQFAALEISPTAVFAPASTTGTVAGLTIGLAPERMPVTTICVFADAATTGTTLDALLAETAVLLDQPVPEMGPVTDRSLGPGYGILTDPTVEAVHLLARKEGIALDPVYNGKGFAEVLRQIRTNELTDHDNVVFIHTGGTPALFAYEEFAGPA